MRSGDIDAANCGARSRGVRHEESDRGAGSDDDGDNEESKADRLGPISAVRVKVPGRYREYKTLQSDLKQENKCNNIALDHG